MSGSVFWAAAPGQLPRGRSFWTTPEMTPPLMARGVVSTMFFGRQGWWLKETRQRLGVTDEMFGPLSWDDRYHVPARAYSLHNVEHLIHLFVEGHAITGEQALRSLDAVLAVGRVHGYGPHFDALAREAADERTDPTTAV